MTLPFGLDATITTVIALRSRATSYRLLDDSSTNGAERSDSLLATAVPVWGETVSIGLTLSEGTTIWAECPAPLADDPPVEGGLLLVQEVIRPLLNQQPLTSVQEANQLMAALDQLTVSQTVRRERPAAGQTAPLSRRELFTGRLAGSPQVEEVTAERPLPAYLRLGVSEAILRATAYLSGQTLGQLVATTFNLPQTDRLVPLQLMVGDDGVSQTVVQMYQPAAQSYLMTQHQLATRLGKTGELLQRFVRRWQQAHQANESYRPTLYLDLNGALGKLTDYNMGKLLGMVYGLNRVVAPFAWGVVDPILGADRDEQINLLAELRELLRLRGVTVPLLARHWVRTPKDVAAYVESGAVDGLHLEPLRLGNWATVIASMAACQGKNTAVILGDILQTTPHSLDLLAQIALAGQPQLVVAPLGSPHSSAILHNTMLRTALDMR
jgi:methylaspartate ammonia-lyase